MRKIDSQHEPAKVFVVIGHYDNGEEYPEDRVEYDYVVAVYSTSEAAADAAKKLYDPEDWEREYYVKEFDLDVDPASL